MIYELIAIGILIVIAGLILLRPHRYPTLEEVWRDEDGERVSSLGKGSVQTFRFLNDQEDGFDD